MFKIFKSSSSRPKTGSYAKEMAKQEERDTYEEVYGLKYYGSDDYDKEFDDDDDGERLSIYDAHDMWLSSGKDEDYTFGYSEDELEKL